jgi:hypothetical protein
MMLVYHTMSEYKKILLSSLQREHLSDVANCKKYIFTSLKIDSVKTLTDNKNLICERNQSGIYLYFIVRTVF